MFLGIQDTSFLRLCPSTAENTRCNNMNQSNLFIEFGVFEALYPNFLQNNNLSKLFISILKLSNLMAKPNILSYWLIVCGYENAANRIVCLVLPSNSTVLILKYIIWTNCCFEENLGALPQRLQIQWKDLIGSCYCIWCFWRLMGRVAKSWYPGYRGTFFKSL